MARNKNYVETFVEDNFFWMSNGQGRAVLHTFVNDRPKVISLDGAIQNVIAWAKSKEHPIKEKTASDLLDSLRLHHAHDVNNAPTKPRLFKDGHNLILNDWRPHKVADVKPSPIAPDAWHDLMFRMFPNDEQREHLDKWFAVLCMRPDWHLRHGIILRSTEHGVGKDVLLETIIGECVLGRNNYVGQSLSSITNRFNALIAGKRLVHVRELYRGQSDSADAMKQLVTSETIRVEEKYEQAYISDFYGAFAITSNDERPIALDTDDRRWFVPEIIEKRFPDEKLHADFFTYVIREFQFEDGGRRLGQYFEKICREFDEVSFNEFSNRPPMTHGKKALLKIDYTSEQKERLAQHLDTFKNDLVFRMSELKDYTLGFASNALHDGDIKEVLESQGFSYKPIRLGDGTTIKAWVHPICEATDVRYRKEWTLH